MAGPSNGTEKDSARISGLRLVILALSLVGLITTYSAVELFRYGGLTAGLRDAIAGAEARRADLVALQRGIDDLARADAGLALSPPPQADPAKVAALTERLSGWTDAPEVQRADRDALLPRLADWTAALSARAAAEGPAHAPSRALLDAEARITAALHRMTDFETAEIARFQSLWGQASREVSRVLSMTLAAIVVLVATVVLRSMAYLGFRDRTEAALRRAGIEAERANAAKSEFLATVSHEIRTPLTGVLGYADLLLATKPRPDQRPRLERLREAGETLGALIDDLLDLSRIEAGRIGIQTAPFDLPALLDRVIALVSPVAAAKGLRLDLATDPALPTHVSGDAKRITQVLLNLLNNAVKFTDHGTVTLSATRDAGGVVFSVTDTGIGIAEADLPKLFQRFSQIDGSNSRSYGGTGLGLAISRGLVEAMGGTISVTSAPGAGSVFRVSLPLVETQAPETDEGAARIAAPPSRILLVEDSVQNREIVQAILERAGHRVITATDGVEGVAAARAGGFDLVLMDMQMPRMDGAAATAAIRALPPPTGRVPILALTANVLPEQIAALRAAGADAHLGKPFTADGLLQACHALLPDALPVPADPQAEAAAAQTAESFDALVGLLGPDWVRGRLGAMVQGLDWIAAPPPEQEELRRRAHRLVSEAGQLGFAALSAAAAGVEEAVLSGGDVAAAIGTLDHAARDARALTPRLMARLGA